MWIKGLSSSCLQFYKEAANVCWTLLNSTENLIQQWNRFFFPLYAEYLHFLIKRAHWIVTKIYAHYTFEQSKFKKRFCYHESGLTSNAKASLEKDFYRLMSNANCGYGCRNNIGNCKFTVFYDEIEEVSYIQKYVSLLFNKVNKDFACPVTMK